MCFLPLDKTCALTHTHTDTQWLWGLWSGLHLGSFLTVFHFLTFTNHVSILSSSVVFPCCLPISLSLKKPELQSV